MGVKLPVCLYPHQRQIRNWELLSWACQWKVRGAPAARGWKSSHSCPHATLLTQKLPLVPPTSPPPPSNTHSNWAGNASKSPATILLPACYSLTILASSMLLDQIRYVTTPGPWHCCSLCLESSSHRYLHSSSFFFYLHFNASVSLTDHPI